MTEPREPRPRGSDLRHEPEHEPEHEPGRQPESGPAADPRRRSRADDTRPVLPDRTADETDVGWGELPESDDDWYERERPPHHGG